MKALPGERSAAVRSYLSIHKGAKAVEVAQALSKVGFDITPQFVYSLQTNDRKRKLKHGKRRAAILKRRIKVKKAIRRAAKLPRLRASDLYSISDIVAARKLADQLGGPARVAMVMSTLIALDKKDVSFEEEDGISAPLIDLSHNGLLSPLP